MRGCAVVCLLYSNSFEPMLSSRAVNVGTDSRSIEIGSSTPVVHALARGGTDCLPICVPKAQEVAVRAGWL